MQRTTSEHLRFGVPLEVIQVEGGHKFSGEVTVEGAKNSALKLMAADRKSVV